MDVFHRKTESQRSQRRSWKQLDGIFEAPTSDAVVQLFASTRSSCAPTYSSPNLLVTSGASTASLNSRLPPTSRIVHNAATPVGGKSSAHEFSWLRRREGLAAGAGVVALPWGAVSAGEGLQEQDMGSVQGDDAVGDLERERRSYRILTPSRGTGGEDMGEMTCFDESGFA